MKIQQSATHTPNLSKKVKTVSKTFNTHKIALDGLYKTTVVSSHFKNGKKWPVFV